MCVCGVRDAINWKVGLSAQWLGGLGRSCPSLPLDLTLTCSNHGDSVETVDRIGAHQGISLSCEPRCVDDTGRSVPVLFGARTIVLSLIIDSDSGSKVKSRLVPPRRYPYEQLLHFLSASAFAWLSYFLVMSADVGL